jgi:hypothetical protein
VSSQFKWYKYIYIRCFCRLFLILSYYFLFSDKKTIIPSNPPPPLPLQPPPSLNQSLNNSTNNKNTFTIVKNNLNHHRHTIIFVTNNNNNTNINDQNLNNFLNTSNNNNNNSLIGESSNIKITPLVICAPSLTQTAHSFYNKSHQLYSQQHRKNDNQLTKQNNITTTNNNNNNQVNSKTNEPIIYIDSIDELENYSISSSISSLSSISSPNKSSQSDTYTIDMNQLLARLKQTTKNLNCDQTNKTNLTPSNSVESFEFISDNNNNNNNNNKNTCYEQSWHNNQTSQILDQITTDKVFTNSSLFLASSLIEIANKHQQQQQQINNKTALKYRKYKSNVPANRRISFPIQKMPSFNEFEKLTSIPSSRIVYNSK